MEEYHALQLIYKKANFVIYDSSDGFIVVNKKSDFKSYHTHMKNFHTCKYLIDCCVNKRLPEKRTSNYIIHSLIRLTNDQIYKMKLESMIHTKTNGRKRCDDSSKHKSSKNHTSSSRRKN